jgi:hypothetical protein
MRRPLIALLLCAGCAAQPLPEDRSQAFLYRDLQRIVTLAESAGWEIDRLELESHLESALNSVCRVSTSSTAALIAWLDRQVAENGGPPERAFLANGRDVDALDDLLELTRIRALLQYAHDVRDQDCPFWWLEDPEYAGEQIFDDRWLLFVAGGGKAILVSRAGLADVRAGAAGRLMFGRGFGRSLALYLGLEAGGVAAFSRDADGDRGNLVIGIDGVVPLVVRYRFVNVYLELEAGYFGRVTEEERSIQPGLHLGAAVGGQSTKLLWFFPGTDLAVSYERTFPREDQGAPLHTLKVGLRLSAELGL